MAQKKSEKQYGLILPGQKKPPSSSTVSSATSKKKNVFGDVDSSDEESGVDWLKQSLKKQSHGSMQQKQSMQVIKKALQDDPSVYEYDEVYDEMERKKEEIRKKEKGDKKPKYIEGLIKTAKTRELENELRRERQAQKDRENEGDEFEDKEAFVTAAYKKKMEDIRKLQEDQDYVDAIDDMTVVTKQQDLSGFYRHLYREKMKDEPDPDASKNPKSKTDERTESGDLPNAEDMMESKEPIIKEEVDSRDSKTAEAKSLPSNRETRTKEDRNRQDRPKRSRSRSTDRDRDRRGRDSRDGHGGHRRSRSPDRDVDHRRDGRGGRGHRRSSRSRSPVRDRDRRRDSRHGGRGSENSRPSDRGRYFNRDDKTTDRHRREPHGSEKDSKSSKPSSSRDKDPKIKIIQKENWYDFDVEIEREVNKDFYSKRTVGKVFEEALQRYLSRKGPEQELDPKSKFV